MMHEQKLRFRKVSLITLCICVMASNSLWAEETAKKEGVEESKSSSEATALNPEGGTSETSEPSETSEAEPADPEQDATGDPATTAAPAETPSVAEAEAAPVSTPEQQTVIPFSDLRRQPRKLRPIAGQLPPPGYVEVEKRRKGLIISGSVVFGALYLGCLIGSVSGDRMLAIPLVGPMIAGFNGVEREESDYYDDYDNDDYADAKYAAKLFGTLGTIGQVTGVALFIAGMATKKKIWLRRDIAGVSFQVTPTLVGKNGPGLGISGTF